MKKKINVKEILDLYAQGYSYNKICSTLKCSKKSVSDSVKKFKELDICIDEIHQYSNDDLYEVFFNERVKKEGLNFEAMDTSLSSKKLYDLYVKKNNNSENSYSYSYFRSQLSKFKDLNKNLDCYFHIHKLREKNYLYIAYFSNGIMYMDVSEEEQSYKIITFLKDSFSFINAIPNSVCIIDYSKKDNNRRKYIDILKDEELGDFAGVYGFDIMYSCDFDIMDKVRPLVSKIDIKSNTKSLRLILREICTKIMDDSSFDNFKVKKFNGEIDFIPSKWEVKKVYAINCHIKVDDIYYSVPIEYIRKRLIVKKSTAYITIYHRRNIVEKHKIARFEPQNTYVTKDDFDDTGIQKDKNYYLKSAEKIGEHTFKLVQELFLKVTIPVKVYLSAYFVLNLQKGYNLDEIEEICKNAIMNNKTSYSDLKELVKKGKHKNG